MGLIDYCRIRRVRCDEQKPSCQRCVSTGRECSGYKGNTAEQTSPKSLDNPGPPRPPGEMQLAAVIPSNPRVLLPRNNSEELRSYSFFVDVTAPMMAGVFDADFWLTDVPQACHLDPAIWHAVVSLAAVHEASISAKEQNPAPKFAIQQFNAAIRHLVHIPSFRTQPEEKRRAVTASILFVYLCSIQGLHSEALVHLEAAKKLIREAKEGSEATATGVHTVELLTSGPLPSMVANLEIQSQALQNGTEHVVPSFLTVAEAYTAWRDYRAPPSGGSSCPHGISTPSRATPVNLARAGRAFESLLNALLALSQHNASDVARLLLGNEQERLLTIVDKQKPYTHAFRELDAAIAMFVLDTSDCACSSQPPFSAPNADASQRMAIASLRLFHAVCLPLLVEKPALKHITGSSPSASVLFHPLVPGDPSPDSASVETSTGPPHDPVATLAEHFNQALSLAESILQHRRASPPTLAGAADFAPALPTTIPLLVMSQTTGVSPALRRRAVALLRRYPRCEGLWDSALGAALAEAVMQREHPGLEEGGDGDNEGAVPAASRKVFGVGVAFTGAHEARVTMRTWEEWLAGESGMERALVW
jgi:hypothetical protein